MRVLLVNPGSEVNPRFKTYAVFPNGILFLAAVLERARLGTKRGSFPAFRGSVFDLPGASPMRNAARTTVAPTGTLSIIAGCSCGIEPLFSVAFVRHMLDGERLLDLGFKPMIIVADSEMGPSMLGKVLTHEILDQLKARYEHLPDENARIYYHTFVIDGPIFKKRLEITESDKVVAGPISYLDIKKFELR
ncbi:hypothetical protein [Dehalogenimonas etheniformans]|nr:hypothetical protein HX448_09570 [Dehalogenimonas etheniformans]